LTLAGDTTTTFTNGKTITLTNLVSTATAGHLATIQSSSAGSAFTFTTASAGIATDYLSIKDSNPTQTNTWYAGTHSTQVSNTGNWLFTNPPNRYWVGGTGNWSDATNHWSVFSNGTPNASYTPTASTPIYFDSNSCASSCIITLGDNVQLGNFSLNNSNATISGNYNISTTGTVAVTAGSISGATLVLAGSSQTITCESVAIINNLTFTAPQTITFTAGKTCTIAGNFTATGSSGNIITMQSSSSGNYFNLSKASGDVSVSYCSIKDSHAEGGASWGAATRNMNTDVSGNTGWIFNSAPEFDTSFGTNGILVSQISDSLDAHFGWVKIQYEPYDSDTFDGLPANQGYATPSFWYKNGESWTGITSQYLASGNLDRVVVGETAEGASTYTAYWDARSHITGNYSAVMQVRVGADDGETSNHLGTSDSAVFTIDAKVPVISVKTLDADTDKLTVSVSDNNNLLYRISTTALAEDGSGGPSFTSVGAVTLSDDLTIDVPTEAPTVYFQIKDIFGNLVSETIVAPNTLANFILKDASNVSAGDFREFMSWSAYTDEVGANFANYKVYRASGDPLSDYALLTTIGNKTTNYYTDTSVLANTPYSYKVKVVDTNGDSSAFTDEINDDAPDGQGGNDVTAPIISSVTVAKVYATWAKITWNTNEPAISIVRYGGQTKTVDSYSTSHEVIITGLDPETEYNFTVESIDISENTAIDDNGGVGYNFTTIAGTVISDVTIKALSDTTATIVWNTSTQTNSHIVYASSTALLETKIATEVLAVSNNNRFIASLFDVVDKYFVGFFKMIWSWIVNSIMVFAEEIEAQDVGSDTIITTASGSGLYAHEVTLPDLVERSTYYFYVKSTDADGNTAIDSNGGAYYSFTTTYDTAPPVISNISTPVISPTSVIVVWDTDELADGKISYGTESGSYALQTSLDTVLTINHVATISGLTASTKYYFVIKSTDANGNEATSEEQEVTTTAPGQTNVYGTVIGSTSTSSGGGGGGSSITLDTTPPTVYDVKVVSDNPFSATVTFSTNEPTIAFVSYGPTSSSYTNTVADTLYGNSHTIKLNNLKMGTLYHLLPSAQDRSGNITQSTDITVTTKFIAETLKDLVVFEDILKFQDQVEGLIQSVLPSLVPPMVANVKVASVTEDSATITWRTNVPSYEGIDYATKDNFTPDKEKPYDQQASQTEKKLTEHSYTISGLQPSTAYHFRVSAHVLPGVIGYSSDGTFATKASASKLEVSKIGNTEFQIQWITSQRTSSVVEYTNTATGKRQQQEDKNLAENHVLKIENLDPATEYSVRTFGYDTDNNLVEGGTLKVKTTRDLKSPEISNVRINSALLPGQSNLLQTVISWLTDEPSTSQVYYDEGVSKSEDLARSVKQEGLTTEHILIVPSLKPSTVYRFRIMSTDQAGNVARSSVKTVLTPEKAENVIDVIVKNLQESFGFLKNLSK